jgi:hypothetical protein
MHDANWLFYLGTAFASLIGAFLGSFLKRLGEDFAAQRSIEKLTATVEHIKAAISDDVWDRQKQWEMKRDTVFEVVRILGELDNALLDLAHYYFVPIPEHGAKVLSERNKAKERWNSNMARFDSARFLVDMVVGKSLSAALSECIKEMHSVAKRAEDGDATSYTSSQAAIKQKVDAIYISARKVLNLKNVSERAIDKN